MKNMKEVFKELIVDFHGSSLPNLIRRDVVLPELPKNVRKAYVFIGMRRSGKTWTLYQIMQDLLSQGLDRSKILYINFEDERLVDMQKKNFQDILAAYFELYPQYLNKSDIYFFFDEIHEIDGWEKFIRRLLDQDKMEIYITGSSSKMLSKEIATSLRGRTFSQEIFPFSFIEYLQKADVVIPKSFGSKSKMELMHHFRNYLQWGGFPETIGTSPEVHRQLLQEYVSSVIYRDIVDRYKIGNSQLLRQLLTHSLRNSARVFSISKMYNDFKSMGYEVSKNSLYEYMSHFEDAYCVFSLSKFDLSHRKSAQSMKKIFPVDPGLITAVTIASNFDLSIQLESAVFSYLRRQSSSIFYYRTADGKEVDFVLILPDHSTHLIQVCLTLQDSNTRRREIDALSVTMQELKIKTGFIITLEEEEEIEAPAGVIYVMPAFKVFLRDFIRK